jgi:transcriptional regulator of acetoin/glycerol metabolism
MQHLVAYAWPGNVRELENLIRFLLVTTPDDTIESVHLPDHIRQPAAMVDDGSSLSGPDAGSSGLPADLSAMTWSGLEKVYVNALLEKHNWNVTWAAKASGLNRSTFASRMRKLDIQRRRPV